MKFIKRKEFKFSINLPIIFVGVFYIQCTKLRDKDIKCWLWINYSTVDSLKVSKDDLNFVSKSDVKYRFIIYFIKVWRIVVFEWIKNNFTKAMVVMKVLKYNFMLMIGIHYSYGRAKMSNKIFKSFAICYAVFLLILSMFSSISCAVFAFQNHFEAALQAIFVIVARIQCAGMYVTVGLKMNEVMALQHQLQRIIDEGEFFFFSRARRSIA